ncbi:Progestin and adipoQ receptor member 4 [Homalodisca vitripennis]|nr:Progestin and adipoQ receptor member 4 [Homalodisca vitripennis]
MWRGRRGVDSLPPPYSSPTTPQLPIYHSEAKHSVPTCVCSSIITFLGQKVNAKKDVLSLVGGAIGALRVPEKWFPGRLDLYCNSHNIMHVLVVCAVYSMYQATVRDLQWMADGQCPPLPLSTAPTIHSEL